MVSWPLEETIISFVIHKLLERSIRDGLKAVPFKEFGFAAACKAHDRYITFAPGINPRPTLKARFSAAAKGRTL